MKFTARIEGYAGTKEYEDINNFVKTVESFLRDSKEGEIIKFTLFDIQEREEKMETTDKEAMILKAVEESKLEWATISDIHRELYSDIKLKRLYHYLNRLRKSGTIDYKKNELGKWVYRGLSKKDDENLITREETSDIIQTKILMKLNQKGYLNDKGKDQLINDLLNENKNAI